MSIRNTTLLLLFILIVSFLAPSYAQTETITIPGVKARKFRGVRSIPGKGFYTYYRAHKEKKGMASFKLHIYDLDMKPVKETSISISKRSYLNEAEFNGTHFFFSFSDPVKRTFSHFIFNDKGVQVKRKVEEKVARWVFSSVQYWPQIFPTEGGFYLVKATKEKKIGYQIEKYTNTMVRKWISNQVPKRGFMMPLDAVASNGKLVMLQISKEKLMSRKFYNEVILFDDNTGKKTSSFELTTVKHTLIPSGVLIEADGAIAVSGMYFDGEKANGTNSDGFFLMQISPKGAMKQLKKHPWAAGMQNFLDANTNKGILGAKPKVVFHSIARKGDTYQLVGETFTKAVSKGGAALSVLAATQGSVVIPPVSLTIKDFIVIELDANSGNLKNAALIEKEYRNFLFEPTIGGGLALATYLKRYGYFSFSFMEQTAEGQNTIIFYSWGKGGTGPYIGSVPIIEGARALETTKIKLNKRSVRNGRGGAVQAKAGFVLIYDLDKKARELSIWLEPLKQ